MIRELKEEDIPACLAIYNPYIEGSTATFETELLSLEEFRQRVYKIHEKYPWLVYEENGTIKGYAYLSAFHERAAYQWACDLAIYVDSKQRGKGIGDTLMNAIIERAVNEGYYQMVSIISSDNGPSVSLHEKHGFIKAGHFERIGYKHGRWLGVDYYVKKLRETEDIPVPVSVRCKNAE